MICREIAEVAETIPPDAVISPTVTSPTTIAQPLNGGLSENYIACYPYESAEVDDLVFVAGEHIRVIKKDGDWWTGVIGTRTGIFPSNYVQPADESTLTTDNDNLQNGNQVDDNATVKTTTANNQYADILAEAKTLEDADTEVSEINTQPKTDQVTDNYSRPMSTSTTPVIVWVVYLNYFILLLITCRAYAKLKERWHR